MRTTQNNQLACSRSEETLSRFEFTHGTSISQALLQMFRAHGRRGCGKSVRAGVNGDCSETVPFAEDGATASEWL